MPDKGLQRALMHPPQRQIANVRVQNFQGLGIAANTAFILVIQQKPGGRLPKSTLYADAVKLSVRRQLLWLVNTFNQEHLNPYINFHRPCFFPETLTDAKGKERKVYRYENLMTPYDKFNSLANAKDYLKPGMTSEILREVAHQISDNQAADQLQKARQTLFKIIHGQGLKAG